MCSSDLTLNIPIYDDLKIRNYNVYLDKEENINSVEIYCLTDKDGDKIIEWYKEKLNSKNSTNDAKGIWNNFEIDVSFNQFSNLVSIVLKKQWFRDTWKSISLMI